MSLVRYLLQRLGWCGPDDAFGGASTVEPESELAYRTIRGRVESGQYPPGSRLPSERKLIESIGIGSTALQQVLARLVGEGLIEVFGRSSYQVFSQGAGVAPPDDLEPWKIHGERTLYDNRWVRLSMAEVQPPGLESFEHHVVHLHHVAIAAIVDDRDRVLMLWRYRFVPQAFGWELPGGIVDPGEDAKATAIREVEEETGWRPAELDHVVSYQPMIGMVDSPHEVFVGRGAEQVGDPTDLEEAGHVAWVPLAEIPLMMQRGELAGSGTLVALLHVLASRREASTDLGSAARG